MLIAPPEIHNLSSDILDHYLEYIDNTYNGAKVGDGGARDAEMTRALYDAMRADLGEPGHPEVSPVSGPASSSR